MRVAGLLVLTMLLSACAQGIGQEKLARFAEHDARPAAPHAFTVCSGYGCAQSRRVSLSAEEWSMVTAHFSPPAADAKAERAQVALAVAEIERLVGPKAGTAGDLGGTHVGIAGPGQQDCLDESMNTGTYLRMLAADGRLRHHTRGERIKRTGLLGTFLPHYSATLVEKGTGTVYAIDSWFEDNGKPPHVVTAAVWADYHPYD